MHHSYGVGVTERSIITEKCSLRTNPHPEKLLWQISTFIDASVHDDKTLHRGLVSDVRVM